MFLKVHIWGEEESKQMKELCIEVLHYLIAPEVIASNPKDFGRICIGKCRKKQKKTFYSISLFNFSSFESCCEHIENG